MNETIMKILTDGYKIRDMVSPYKFGEGVQYYIKKKYAEKFKDAKLYILEKDGKLTIVSGDD